MTMAEARKAFPKLHMPGGRTEKRYPSKAEQLFAFQCAAEKLPSHVREYCFALSIGRAWRFDFAWPDLKVAVEIEGLVKRFINGKPYMLGRHATFSGFTEDCIKYANANILGWHVLRFNQALVKDGSAIELTAQMFVKPWPLP